MGTGNQGDQLRLRDRSLEWRAIQGEVVALDLESSEYLHVNRTGADLWALLASGTTRDGLRQHLVDKYGLEPDAAAKDVDAFLDALTSKDLLQS